MVAFDRRQIGQDAGTADGVFNSATVVNPTVGVDTSGLVLDEGAATTGTFAPPPLVSGSTPVVTEPPTITPPPSEPTASQSVEPVSASGKSISLSTVIGSCVGAFVGAALLIAVGFYYYRRYSASLKQKSRRRPLPRSPFTDNRGAGENRNSKTWNRLDSGEFEDKWEGKDAGASTTRRVPDHLTVPPLEKMDMFKKSPSTSSHHHSSADDHTFEMQQANHPYAQVDNNNSTVPGARDLLGRDPIDSGPPLSWASGSPSQTSFLSAAQRIESGAMSPTLAIPTPPATRSQPHHWESAEVVNIPEAQSAEYFVEDDSIRGSRTSLHNPFFSGGGHDHMPPRRRSTVARSRSNSTTTRSRSNSNATITQHHQPDIPDIVTPTLPRKNSESKFVEDNRESLVDPFNDPLPPAPTFRNHNHTGSASSAASNERAIRQLVAAAGMDLNEDEVQRRLKAVSMQPSVISNSGDSMYTDAEPELAEEALRSFPQPPSSISSHGGSRI